MYLVDVDLSKPLIITSLLPLTLNQLVVTTGVVLFVLYTSDDDNYDKECVIHLQYESSRY